MKRCTKCGGVFDEAGFYATHTSCKSCLKAYQKAHYVANRASICEKQRAYNRRKLAGLTPEEREIVRAEWRRREALWRSSERGKGAIAASKAKAKHERRLRRAERLAIRALAEPLRRARKAEQAREWHQNNRDRRREYLRKWKSEHPELVYAYEAKRRARGAGVAIVDPDPTIAEFHRTVKTAERISCYYCGRNVPKRERHIDHIKPLSKGGPHAVSNLCCACRFCNLSKHDKLPEEFGVLAI